MYLRQDSEQVSLRKVPLHTVPHVADHQRHWGGQNSGARTPL